MNIAYYCQHVLGVGHFHRSLEICRELSKKHTVTMIVGGAPMQTQETDVVFYQLPGLMMDNTFNNLSPCSDTATLEETKTLRQKALYDYFIQNSPDVFLIELYPFGRKAFRFELDPVLHGIKNGELGPCLTFCSLRDILVERDDKIKFENRTITTLNSLFNGLFIHGDKTFIALDETFSRVSDITIPFEYTGYVAKNSTFNSRLQFRQQNNIPTTGKLMVASIGGGSVGEDLLTAVATAHSLLNDHSLYLQIFTGPYASPALITRLQNMQRNNMKVDRFTSEFPCWLAAADLSVSMAGYNTCMDVLSAGTPALFYPFSQNHEQRMRVERLENLTPCKLLQPRDLQPQHLADLIKEQLNKNRFSSPVNLNGAFNTLALIEKWYDIFRETHEQ